MSEKTTKKFRARARGARRLSRSKGGDAAIFIMLVFFGAFMILPFVYAILQSLKPMEEIFAFPPRFFVVRPTMDNYYQLSQLTSNLWVPFGRYLMNSLFVTAVGTVSHIVLASMAAFVLAKYRFPGSRVMSEAVTLALMFSAQVTAIPQYVLMAKMGMINTYWALILPSVAGTLGLFLMRNFMVSLPFSLIESANIDGAGLFRIFWQIVMPNVKPAWLTLLIFTFQSLWNGAGSRFIYTESLKVLPTILNQISSAGIARAGVGSAVAVVLMIPPIITFLLVESNVLETMAHSGIKD